MSSFDQEPSHTSTPNPRTDARFDSGLGSSINQLSGSFREGNQSLPLDSYEAPEGEFDSLLLDGGPGLLSLQPQSLVIQQPVTADFDPISSNHELSGSTSEPPADRTTDDTGSTSTIAATYTNTAHTDPAMRHPSSSFLDEHNSETDSNPTHDDVIQIADVGNSELPDTQQYDDDPPSPVLSHVRAEPLTIPVKETIIRRPVVEHRPELIYETTLTERGHSHSPP